MTIPLAILSLRPAAEFVMYGDELVWLDKKQSKPSDDEIKAELKRLIEAQPDKDAKVGRLEAMRNEADPIFFKYQRGEATKEEWVAKIDDIRKRFPYSTDK